ncbi:hypothetical protein DFA_03112 [Cavenderia fasciculata]|uniref:Peptidase C1A papain C-terminal domain-containing protein n=1 Tax=Cavenderia fasciculata TaxID=261658 RepID=F4PGN3_CACFS|nr:uncharacterized protein DFA_03112 [Cavenderia fasciculata]EGG24867.1 hypothetical protein DFA_03112 [Cavenderia fasciculata]|eukprot:XP_004362718.1 hypothetical protein DFA_03112 [Cavenderia fasciculata]
MELGTNEFADLSLQEFIDLKLSKFNMSEITDDLFTQHQPDNNQTSSSTSSSESSESSSLSPSSSSYNSNTSRCISSNCGLGKEKKNLSEQNFVDCQTFGNKGCEGGCAHNAYHQVLKGHGVSHSNMYPYVGYKNTAICSAVGLTINIRSYAMTLGRKEFGLTKALLDTPVSASFDASSREFQLYVRGIFSSPTCDKLKPSHSVLVTGYQPGAWLIKNSFGVNWGEAGFFRLARNTDDKCGIASFASYPEFNGVIP